MPTTLELKHVGPIVEARVAFGDLTVLVGPQASGKSIFLQFFKLLQDDASIASVLRSNGFDWGQDVSEFLDVYLGEGMRGIWESGTSRTNRNGRRVDLQKLVSGRAHHEREGRHAIEKVFFVPAQRVLTLGRGWPRPFTDYSAGDPFVVRNFSEQLRRLVEDKRTFHGTERLFPETRRLAGEVREILSKAIFSRFGLQVSRQGAQKRLVLRGPVESDGSPGELPFMVWSAGQREFVPLLLGIYWLCPPPNLLRRSLVQWVVIEELEMGLHPQAISAVMVVVLDLLRRGYRVVLSTHSSQVLDVVWALRTIAACEGGADRVSAVLDLFELRNRPATRELAESSLAKAMRVFYFDRDSGRTSEISDLDPDSADPGVAGWGGLSEFAGRASEVVARIVESTASHRGGAP